MRYVLTSNRCPAVTFLNITIIVLITLMTLSGCQSRRSVVDGSGEINTAMAKVYPALVRIYVVMEAPGNGRMQRMQGAGSGAIISKDGYVVTNHHVAGNGSRIVVNMSNHEEIEAELIGTDPLADIAILKLKTETRKNPNAPLPVAQWGDSDKVNVGDVVLAMGSPGALSQSVTRGIVSNTQLIMPGGRSGAFRLDGESVGSVVRWIAHDAVIFGGNSGGPLVNLDGQIVGINEIGVASLGGAIPSNLAKSVALELIAHGSVKRSWTGLECQPRLKSDQVGRGVLLAGVIKDSPADKAGLKAGDIIIEYRGQKVDVGISEQMPAFNQLVLSTPIGEKVTVKYLRDNNEQTTRLATVERQRALGEPEELKQWGIAVRNITRRMALARKRKNTQGAMVQSVRAGGPNADSKLPLVPGDVILEVEGHPIHNSADLVKITKQLTEGKTSRVPTLVKFERGKDHLITVIKIGYTPLKDPPARAEKPWAGFETQVLTTDLVKALKLKTKQGVRVIRVFGDKNQEPFPVKVGDILLQIDGMNIEASQPEDTDVFDTTIRQYEMGTEVDLRIVRDGKKQKIKLKLLAPPPSSDYAKRYQDKDFEFTARDLGHQDRTAKDLEKSVEGVVIDRVIPAGWAALGGLRQGDVLISFNGKPTSNVEQLKTLLNQVRKDQPRRITLFIRRGIHTRYLEIEPFWR